MSPGEAEDKVYKLILKQPQDVQCKIYEFLLNLKKESSIAALRTFPVKSIALINKNIIRNLIVLEGRGQVIIDQKKRDLIPGEIVQLALSNEDVVLISTENVQLRVIFAELAVVNNVTLN